MKYFVLYFTCNGKTDELYLKGKSMKHMEERIQRYSNGSLATSKWSLQTINIDSCFLSEVDPAAEFPHLTSCSCRKKS